MNGLETGQAFKVSAGMESSVDIVIEDDRWRTIGLEVLAEAAFAATMSELDLTAAELSCCVMACDDARIAVLNAEFRGKPVATNVLSWPSEERGTAVEGKKPEVPQADEGAELGDIAIAYDTCATEAAAAGKPMGAHVTHLLVHGYLHLLGYDHQREGDAVLMEGTEVRILAQMGLSDPYSV